MKSIIKYNCLILLLLAVSTSAMAQNIIPDTAIKFRTWSFGLNGGSLTHWTPFNRVTNGDYRTTHHTLGYGFYLKDQLLSNVGLQLDFLGGKVHGTQLNNVPVGTLNPENSGYNTRINWSAALSVNLTIPNLNLNNRHDIFPYATIGGGYMGYSATVYNAPGANSNSNQKTWFIPIGLGFKIGVSDRVGIDLGYRVYAVKTNNFDGYRSGLYDHFSYIHGGIEYSLGKKSRPKLQNYSPVAALNDENAARNARLQAELAEAERKRLAEQQQYERDMADDDHDGVANKFDKCPDTPANTPVDGSGCPIKIPAPVITEKVITEQDRRVIGDAIKDLEFEWGKATIKTKSYPVLDRVADLLIKKDFSLKLAGHTDNTGSMLANFKLSKARAQAVKNYLVKKGANASRIEATGYGYTQPIATNKTAKGRAMNRRVEFSLF
ncbi:OmpA family protein [Mucilaginibacter pedocola]|uniref:Flagellar motor protein MotB n=1 Tax=Mucilaginibacter pedocola TaxID=1792845 RepID=A0A1S9PA09_9SPHI|nr:OmpA family protein [Mucilaginibacter pedocola]OOQ57759.1 flagellar motor protein MotB [Mucilaginibacter pedocola]